MRMDHLIAGTTALSFVYSILRLYLLRNYSVITKGEITGVTSSALFYEFTVQPPKGARLYELRNMATPAKVRKSWVGIGYGRYMRLRTKIGSSIWVCYFPHLPFINAICGDGQTLTKTSYMRVLLAYLAIFSVLLYFTR